ncbi:MAG TPA: portal protein [Chloroflexi bacterium]|nr:portal protein [Chloroflexota bacterium]
MYIVVVGGGKVGYHLTKSLLAEEQEVLVIERNGPKADRITRDLGATALVGDGAEVATLEQAGLERADVVAAVTGHDEDNLIIAQVAKRRFNVPRTVARINNPRNEFIFTELGIDATVSATQVILSIIQQEIPQHPFVHLLSLQEGGIEFVELQLVDTSPSVGKTINEVGLPDATAVPLLIRNGKPLIAEHDLALEKDDHIVAVTVPEQEAALRARFLGSAL